MPTFPSTDWFQALADLVRDDADFRKFGTIDLEMGVEVGDEVWKVVFEAFEVTEVVQIDAEAAEPLDFVLSMTPSGWHDMLENIKQNGAADLDHTLNTLDLNNPENFARGQDYHRRDKFYRFNQTLQDFFDASARLDTSFAD